MKFWEALKIMQEEGKRGYVKTSPDVTYYWGDVLDIPCLKNNIGHEVLINSWYMAQEWAIEEKVISITESQIRVAYGCTVSKCRDDNALVFLKEFIKELGL